MAAKAATGGVFLFLGVVISMNFERLYKRIAPRIKLMAYGIAGKNFNVSLDEKDLFQEAVVYLWNNFRNGVPEGINDSYIIKGCKFHLLNYIRKKRNKAWFFSIDKPIDDQGNTLGDILPEASKPLRKLIDRNMAVEHIYNNGFSKKAKKVFSLLLKGYTVREVGEKVGISHVMVVKYKKQIIDECRNLE